MFIQANFILSKDGIMVWKKESIGNRESHKYIFISTKLRLGIVA